MNNIKFKLKLLLRPIYRKWRTRQLDAISKKLSKQFGDVVLDGSFKGLKYCKDACVTFPPSKRIGSYECELSPVVEHIVSNNYDRIVDVGSAEGYYAVGLLTRTKSSLMFAYEITPGDRDWLLKNAKLNRVTDRLTIGEFCTPEVLQSIIKDRTFIFCDCEGYEEVLIDPDKVPLLNVTDMLIECHEDSVPGITEKLRTLFDTTHDILPIMPKIRQSSHWKYAGHAPWYIRQIALSDHRSKSEGWLFLTLKSEVGSDEL
jgi:hypothetical protein